MVLEVAGALFSALWAPLDPDGPGTMTEDDDFFRLSERTGTGTSFFSSAQLWGDWVLLEIGWVYRLLEIMSPFLVIWDAANVSGKPIFNFGIGLNAGAKRRTSKFDFARGFRMSDLGTDDADA